MGWARQGLKMGGSILEEEKKKTVQLECTARSGWVAMVTGKEMNE